MANLTPGHYSKLIRRSSLPPTVRLVALTLAALRFDDQLTSKPHKPLEVTRERIAADCGLTVRAVGQALKALSASGWLRSESVYRDGRQRGSRYWLLDAEQPSTTTTEGTTFPQYRGNERTLNRGNDVPTVVRSNNRGASDTAPQSAGAGSDETRQPEPEPTAEPVPALGGAEPEPASETAVLDAWQEQHRDKSTGQCRHCGIGHAVVSGYGTYDGKSNETRPRLWECSSCGLPWPRPRLVAS